MYNLLLRFMYLSPLRDVVVIVGVTVEVDVLSATVLHAT